MSKLVHIKSLELLLKIHEVLAKDCSGEICQDDLQIHNPQNSQGSKEQILVTR